MEAEAALPLPDDALAAILARLPPGTLAASRCVCKAWRAVVDARGLLLPHLLPHAVRGIFVNYIGYWRPLFFARPSSALPRISGNLGYKSIIDHCNGLLLCGRGGEFVVVNPATRRWERFLAPRVDTYNRDYLPYLVFDPAVSPHYEVFLIPRVPEKPEAIDPRDIPTKTYNVSGLFSSFDHTLDAESMDEEEELCMEEWMQPPPPPSMEEGFFPTKRLSLSLRWKMGEPVDTYGSMEWPPSPCTLHVFSSRTRCWEERTFVREGNAMGTVKDARRELLRPMFFGPRWHYGVYFQGALYVHCRGGFVMRLSLAIGKYQTIKTPVDIEEKYRQTYLGRSAKGLYFATIKDFRLRVWILNGSPGQIEWTLKYDTDLDHSGLWTAVSMSNHHRTVGPWFLSYANNSEDNYNSMLQEGHLEWDSDDDGILHSEDVDKEYNKLVYFLGFHPYKEVVFLMVSFTAIAYHLNTSKIQWLGTLHPKNYDAYTKGVHEAFPYTPCMVGDPVNNHETSTEDGITDNPILN
ncbi:hypothetical protein ACP70R_016445 [Stipagrostis hirtigluma subsp. patula]